MEKQIEDRIFKIAFKKLKSSVYYDKTQLILRNDIVRYEQNSKDKIDSKLESLCTQFNDDNQFKKLQKAIINSISISAFPKKLIKSQTPGVIINKQTSQTTVNQNQYFIDMCVEGHILGVVWLMTIGYKLDKLVYEKSYGNRIRKKLINELSDEPTFSPYLFEPYFMQYESWRDTALDEAKKYLHQKNDVMILTMDLKRYFYSVDVTQNAFDKMLEDAGIDKSDEANCGLVKLNDLMYDIVNTYAEQFGEEFENRNILPIGFLPSNVISNWCLRNLDKAIIDGWNPAFYGRYVDDILIVDKIEPGSKIFNLIRSEPKKVNVDFIMDYYTEKCCKWYDRNKDATSCKGLFFKCDQSGYPLSNPDANDVYYRVNFNFNPTIPDTKSKLIVQNEKMKLFYFLEGETDALIDCFKNQISKNKSEFRHMPEDDAFYQKDQYNEIYSLVIDNGINKFREVKDCTLDKFGLSKFLGKHLQIAGMVSGFNESKFEHDIEKIFTPHVTLEYYIFWERIIETLVINENYDALYIFLSKVVSAISEMSCSNAENDPKNYDPNWVDRTSNIKRSMYKYLISALARSYSLLWKHDTLKSAIKILKINTENNSSPLEDCLKSANSQSSSSLENVFSDLCLWYCKSRMIDKSVLPVPIDLLLPFCTSRGNKLGIFSIKNGINITNFQDALETMLSLESKSNKTGKDKKGALWPDDGNKTITKHFNYIYYPYMVGMNEISIAACLIGISNDGMLDLLTDDHTNAYANINYNNDKTCDSNIIEISKHTLSGQEIKTIYVGTNKKSKLRIAVANACLFNFNITELYNGKPQRSYSRYQALSKIVNQAINEKADMLVLPEAYVPFEWLPRLSKTCERNNLAIVCGVEYLINPITEKVFNLTAVILPFIDNVFSGTNITFHLKNHYAPVEKSTTEPRGLQLVQGKQYELYRWNGCYFAVYCCYELASIRDRALFQAYADAIIAIEWNKDVNYYSNILESLSRDVHCYCIQVNSADYGDSRITQPSPTVSKDLVRTKGGTNETILVGVIDVTELRRFQMQGQTFVSPNSKFKPTPPNFDIEVVKQKYNNKPLRFDVLNNSD